MGSRAGALKVAAGRVGVTVAEYRRHVGAGEKWCTACKAWRPRAQFGADRSRGDGLKARCRTHEERVDAPTKRQRVAMRAEGLAWCGACRWWLDAVDVKGGRCGPHRRQREREWYRNGGRAYRLAQAAQRRGVDSMPNDWRDEFLIRPCAYCPAPADTIDHVLPVALGGRTTPDNCVPACRSCNSRKKDSDPLLWVSRMRNSEFERITYGLTGDGWLADLFDSMEATA